MKMTILTLASHRALWASILGGALAAATTRTAGEYLNGLMKMLK